MSRLKHDPELVKKIKDGIKVDDVQTSSDDTFYENLPSGHTRETEKVRNDYVTTYVASAVEAHGDLAIERMAKDDKLDTVSAHIGLGVAGYVDLDVDRSKTIPVPGKKGETTTIKGATKLDVHFTSGENGGLLKKSRAAIRETAEAKL